MCAGKRTPAASREMEGMAQSGQTKALLYFWVCSPLDLSSSVIWKQISKDVCLNLQTQKQKGVLVAFGHANVCSLLQRAVRWSCFLGVYVCDCGLYL